MDYAVAGLLGGTIVVSFGVKMVLEALTWLGLAGWYWWDASAFDGSHFRIAALTLVYLGPFIILFEFLKGRQRAQAAATRRASGGTD